jgi:hypothetical protein
MYQKALFHRHFCVSIVRIVPRSFRPSQTIGWKFGWELHATPSSAVFGKNLFAAYPEITKRRLRIAEATDKFSIY